MLGDYLDIYLPDVALGLRLLKSAKEPANTANAKHVRVRVKKDVDERVCE